MPRYKKSTKLSLYKKPRKRPLEKLSLCKSPKRKYNVETPIVLRCYKRPMTFSPSAVYKRKCVMNTPTSIRFRTRNHSLTNCLKNFSRTVPSPLASMMNVEVQNTINNETIENASYFSSTTCSPKTLSISYDEYLRKSDRKIQSRKKLVFERKEVEDKQLPHSKKRLLYGIKTEERSVQTETIADFVSLDSAYKNNNNDYGIVSENEDIEMINMCSKLIKTNLGPGNNPTFIDEESDETKQDVFNTIQLLLKLVKEGKYSTSSLSFRLFQDALKWYASDNTSSMRYSTSTKEFFWTGQRLLGGQFIRFMRGFAHQGLVTERKAAKGNYNPSLSGINLPVPSDRILKEFKPSGIVEDKLMEPGILHGNIKTYGSAMPEVSYVVMFDGKKITPQSAEIFLLDKEEEPKISNIRLSENIKVAALEQFLQYTEKLIESGKMLVFNLSQQEKEHLLASGKDAIKVIGSVTQSLRESYCKKAVYLQNSQKKFEETSEAKYKFVCNRVRTIMYQLSICCNDLLAVVDSIMEFCTELSGTRLLYSKQMCDMNSQENYRELKTPNELRSVFCKANQNIPPKYIKQRSPEWFELRKTVKVTGSVMHTAVGLETLEAQRKYFDLLFSQTQQSQLSADQQQAMHHGTVNEINAVATLIGKILPVYYPNYIFYEEGTYGITTEDGDGRTLVIVSPDGSLRDQANNITVSVEIKCPHPSYVGTTPVFYSVKHRHILQSSLEAAVLDADEHLYISWSRDSTTVFRMKPNKNLIKNAMAEVERVYYGDIPARPTKVGKNVKSMKESILEEVNRAEFLGEFPSLLANSKVCECESTEDLYYKQNASTDKQNQSEFTLTQLVQSLYKGIRHVKDAFSYQKPMASEVLVYLLSDMERTWHKEIGHGLPVSYLFKGYSLTMGTARRILDEVMNACHENGVHVPCVTFDGQFAKLKDVNKDDEPLTLFSLHRKCWSEVQKLTKRQLLNEICNLYSKMNHFAITEMTVSETGELIPCRRYLKAQNNNQICKPIETSIVTLKRIAKHSLKADDEKRTIGMVDSAGLEEEVVNILEQIPIERTPEKEPDISYNNLSADVSLPQEMTDDDVNPIYGLNQTDVTPLNENDVIVILKILQGSKRHKWKDTTPETMTEILGSAEKMNKELTGMELNEVSKYINIKIKKFGLVIRQNLRKGEKINAICSYVGHSSRVLFQLKGEDRKA